MPLCGRIVNLHFRRTAGRHPIRRLTGLELDAYFSATKINWLLKHTNGAKAKAKAGRLALGMIDLAALETDRRPCPQD